MNPRYEREFDLEKAASQRPGPLTFSDLMLSSTDWSSLVFGRLGASIDVDSKMEHIRRNSEERLAQELRYASHLGLLAVMVSLQGPHHTNLARIISNTIQKVASFQIWVQWPLTAPDMEKYKDIFETCDWRNRFRLVAVSHNKINLCLGITETRADLASQSKQSDWKLPCSFRTRRATRSSASPTRVSSEGSSTSISRSSSPARGEVTR